MNRLCALLVFAFASAAPTAALAQGYVCAEGGGNPGKGAWADEVFGWMVQKGGQGPAIIIGAVALDAADQPDNRESLFRQLGAKSCSSLVIDEKNADAQATYDAITGATIVFIRGGAQDRYVRWWKGTKTEQAIHAVFDKGGVIAGTSAGCAILGEVSYDAIGGSLKPLEALQDGRHPHLTLTTDFLGLVPGVLFDTHFTERGRIARLPVMLAHARDILHRDDIVGVGVDPRTALCVDHDGKAEVRGEGTISTIRFTIGTRSLLFEGKPPLIVGAYYSCFPSGTRLDLRSGVVLSPTDPIPEDGRSKATCQNITIEGKGEEVAADAPAPEGPEGGEKQPKQPKVLVQWWPRVAMGVPVVSVAGGTWDHPSDSVSQSIRRLAVFPGPMALFLCSGNKAVCENRTLKIEGAGTPAAAVIIDTRSVSSGLVDWNASVRWAKQPHLPAAPELLNEYMREHPDEFKDLTPEKIAAKASELSHQLLQERETSLAWLDEEGTYQRLKLDKPGARPSILLARLHILPPGSSIDLDTGQVPIFRVAKPDPPK